MQNMDNLLDMNIQLLAGEDNTGDGSLEQNPGATIEQPSVKPIEQNSEQTQSEKVFTQEDIDKIISKKFAQWQKKNDAEKKELEEAEKLKRMSENERQQAEMKKQIDEFNKMKAEMAREKLSNQVVKELASRELPIEYAEYLMVDGDAEATMDRLTVFEQKYKADIKAMVDKQVQERLKGNVPKTSTVEVKGEFTAEDVRKMTPEEINRNWEKIKHIKLV